MRIILFLLIINILSFSGIVDNLQHYFAQYEYKNKEYKEALKSFKKLPKNSTTHFEIATTLYRLNKYKEAISHYKLASTPKLQGIIYFNIANCYYKMGQYNKASAFYKSASKYKTLKTKALKNLKITKKKAKLIKESKLKNCKAKKLGLGKYKTKLYNFDDPFVSKNLKLAKLKNIDKANILNSKNSRTKSQIELLKEQNSTKKSDKLYSLDFLKQQRLDKKLQEKKSKTLLIPIIKEN